MTKRLPGWAADLGPAGTGTPATCFVALTDASTRPPRAQGVLDCARPMRVPLEPRAAPLAMFVPSSGRDRHPVPRLMHVIEPLRYKAWADRRTLDAVAAIDAQVAPSSRAFALQQLNHLVRVEELFRARLAGIAEPHASTNTERLPPLCDLDTRLTASNAWLLDHYATLAPQRLREDIRFTFTDGKPGRLSREEIAFHLINHGTYHRGAIGHALDLAGAARPADTYTVFIHASEPDRRS